MSLEIFAVHSVIANYFIQFFNQSDTNIPNSCFMFYVVFSKTHLKRYIPNNIFFSSVALIFHNYTTFTQYDIVYTLQTQE